MTTVQSRSRPRVGVIGSGFMAEVHIKAARTAGAEVVGIASSDRASAERAARRFGVEVPCGSALELIEHSRVDLVHVCTPNATHAELASATLMAGKHVICEKPLATSAADASDLVSLARHAGRVAAVPFVYRFHPMVREARARVQNGEVGRVFVVKGEYLQDWLVSADDDNWRVNLDSGGPSRAFADIGSHLCDLIEFVTGDSLEQVSAVASTVHTDRLRSKNVRTEDAVVVTLKTRGGAIGSLVVSQVSMGRKNVLSFEISGQNETLCFNQESPELLWIGRRAGFTALSREAAFLDESAKRYSLVPSGHPMGYQDAFNAFVRDAYAAVDGPSPAGLPTFADGYRAVLLTEAVLKSSNTGGWVSTSTCENPAEPHRPAVIAAHKTGGYKTEGVM